MKHLDLFSRRVLVVGIVICSIVFSMTLLVQATDSAFAQEPPPEAAPPANLNGRFIYEPYQRVTNNSKGQFVKTENYVFVYDSQTGWCMDYYLDKGKFVPAKEQLPQPTLPKVKEMLELQKALQ